MTGADLTASIGALKSEMINSHKTVIVVPGVGTNLRNIDCRNQWTGADPDLSLVPERSMWMERMVTYFYQVPVTRLPQEVLFISMYFKDQSSGTNFDGWMEVGVSVASGR